MSIPPQPQGWPQQPPPQGVWAQPPVIVKRIPQDQPFIVRHSAPKRALQFGLFFLFVAVVVNCPLWLAAADSGEGAPPVLVTMGGLLAFFALVFGLQIYARLRRTGPRGRSRRAVDKDPAHPGAGHLAPVGVR
jgi:hypothetical protein